MEKVVLARFVLSDGVGTKELYELMEKISIIKNFELLPEESEIKFDVNVDGRIKEFMSKFNFESVWDHINYYFEIRHVIKDKIYSYLKKKCSIVEHGEAEYFTIKLYHKKSDIIKIIDNVFKKYEKKFRG